MYTEAQILLRNEIIEGRFPLKFFLFSLEPFFIPHRFTSSIRISKSNKQG
jgi:hypothetical protein